MQKILKIMQKLSKMPKISQKKAKTREKKLHSWGKLAHAARPLRPPFSMSVTRPDQLIHIWKVNCLSRYGFYKYMEAIFQDDKQKCQAV